MRIEAAVRVRFFRPPLIGKGGSVDKKGRGACVRGTFASHLDAWVRSESVIADAFGTKTRSATT